MNSFKIEKKIGKGTFGSIYKCTFDGETKAVKKYKTDDDGTLYTETLRELSILQEVRDTHSNLLSFDKILFEDGIYCLITKLYDRDLHTLIEDEENLSENILINIAYKLLHVIDFLHKNNIIHRDIKSSNILMDGYEPILADFGLSKYFSAPCDKHPFPRGGKCGYPCNSEFTHTDSISTRTYRSPEVCEKKRYGLISDDWSLGIVIYETVQGSIIDINTDDMLFKFLPTYIKIFVKEHPRWAELIKGLLTYSPAKRMTSGQALKLDIFNGYIPSFDEKIERDEVAPKLKKRGKKNIKSLPEGPPPWEKGKAEREKLVRRKITPRIWPSEEETQKLIDAKGITCEYTIQRMFCENYISLKSYLEDVREESDGDESDFSNSDESDESDESENSDDDEERAEDFIKFEHDFFRSAGYNLYNILPSSSKITILEKKMPFLQVDTLVGESNKN